MISLGTENKQPQSVLTYNIVSSVLLSAILVGLGILFMSLGTIHGTATVNGVTSPTAISGNIPGFIFILLALLIPVGAALSYFFMTYVVNDQGVTVNSGVLFRKSVTIDFNKIQNVDNERGPLLMLFGLTKVNIWTASPEQLDIVSTSDAYGHSNTRTIHRPSGSVCLDAQDATDLKNYLASKSSVQNVQMVNPQVQPIQTIGQNPPSLT